MRTNSKINYIYDKHKNSDWFRETFFKDHPIPFQVIGIWTLLFYSPALRVLYGSFRESFAFSFYFPRQSARPFGPPRCYFVSSSPTPSSFPFSFDVSQYKYSSFFQLYFYSIVPRPSLRRDSFLFVSIRWDSMVPVSFLR